MCGKAPPFRFKFLMKHLLRLRLSQVRGTAPDNCKWSISPVRRSLTVHQAAEPREKLLLFWLLSFRFRWRAKIAVCDKARTRRIIFQRFATHPDVVFALFRSLDLVNVGAVGVALTFCRNRNLALEIGAPKFHVGGFQTIKHNLRRVAVTIPGAVGNDCG